VVPRSINPPSLWTEGFLFPTGKDGAIDTGQQWEIIGRIALAAVLGALIGLEREYRGYPAGVRTMALVCMGSALFADMSREYGGDDRIAAQIVTGIGFLGAGLIFREGVTIKGVTTAATIWAVAAVGVAIGIEAYLVATFASLLAVAVLELRIITKNMHRGRGAERDDDEDGEATSGPLGS
jgi:putative Mg2+ transporter-C (MgtC) family protein